MSGDKNKKPQEVDYNALPDISEVNYNNLPDIEDLKKNPKNVAPVALPPQSNGAGVTSGSTAGISASTGNVAPVVPTSFQQIGQEIADPILADIRKQNAPVEAPVVAQKWGMPVTVQKATPEQQNTSYLEGPLNAAVSSTNQTLGNIGKTYERVANDMSEAIGLPAPFQSDKENVFDYANKEQVFQPAPDNFAGHIEKGIGAMAPDLAAVYFGLPPELKLAEGVNFGRFPALMGAKSFAESYGNGKPLDESVQAGLKGVEEGAVMHSIGEVAGSIGKATGDFVKDVNDKKVLTKSAAAFANMIGFGGYDAAKQYAETGEIDLSKSAEASGMGLAFELPGLMGALHERAFNNLVSTPADHINEVLLSPKTPEQLRQEALSISQQIPDAPEEQKSELQAKVNYINKVADIKSIAKSITEDPEVFINSIKQDKTLSPEEKREQIEKVNRIMGVKSQGLPEHTPLKDVELDTDAIYDRQFGKLTKTDLGEWEFVPEGGGPGKLLKVEDKNNPTETLGELGIQVKPVMDPEAPVFKNRERVGEVEKDGRKYFVSLGDPNNPNDFVGDKVLRVNPNGSVTDIFANHKDPKFAQERKLSIANKFLKEQGFEPTTKLWEPTKAHDEIVDEIGKVTPKSEVKEEPVKAEAPKPETKTEPVVEATPKPEEPVIETPKLTKEEQEDYDQLTEMQDVLGTLKPEQKEKLTELEKKLRSETYDVEPETEATPEKTVKDIGKDKTPAKAITVTVAPYRKTVIKNVDEANDIRNEEGYKEHVSNLRNIAQILGLKVSEEKETIGGFFNEDGEKIQEVSNRFVFDTKDKDKVKLFAALAGSLSPEVQESVLVGNYNKKGSGIEAEFQFKSPEEAQSAIEALKDHELFNFSFDDKNNVLYIADPSGEYLSNIADFKDKVNGTLKEEPIVRRADIEFPEEKNDGGGYAGLLNEARLQADGGQGGANIRKLITQAEGALKATDQRRAERDKSAEADGGGRLADFTQTTKEERGQLRGKVRLPNSDVQAVADGYAKENGLKEYKQHDPVPVDPQKARSIADVYDSLPEDDGQNEEVKAAYEALATELQSQWDYLKKAGYEVKFWTEDGTATGKSKDGQPYANSAEMMADVQKNKSLTIFTGGDPHPFLGPHTADADGVDLNLKLRAVHDILGHAAAANEFGATGEENAWIEHSKLFSPLAQKALTTETRGQNSWVNFNKDMWNEDGSYRGDERNPNYVPATDRPYAIQKVGLLPEEYLTLDGKKSETKKKQPEEKLLSKEATKQEPAPETQKVTPRGMVESAGPSLFSHRSDANLTDIILSENGKKIAIITEHKPTRGPVSYTLSSVFGDHYELPQRDYFSKTEIREAIANKHNEVNGLVDHSATEEAATEQQGKAEKNRFKSFKKDAEALKTQVDEAAKAVKKVLNGGIHDDIVKALRSYKHKFLEQQNDPKGTGRLQGSVTRRYNELEAVVRTKHPEKSDLEVAEYISKLEENPKFFAIKNGFDAESLVDLTAHAIKKSIDAGISVADAIDAAITKVKGTAVYKKLVETGVIKDDEFDSMVRGNFKPEEMKKAAFEEPADLGQQSVGIGITHEAINEVGKNNGGRTIEKMGKIGEDEAYEEGRKMFERGGMEQKVVEWSQKGTVLNSREQAALHYHIADLDGKYEKTYSDWEEAKSKGSDNTLELRQDSERLLDQLDNARQVAFDTRSEAGRTLGSFGKLINKDMSLSNLMRRYKVINDADNVPSDVEEKLRDISKRYEEAMKDLEDSQKLHQEKDVKIAALEKFKDEKRKAERAAVDKKKEARHETKEQRITASKARVAELKTKLSEIVKKMRGQFNAMGSLQHAPEFISAIKAIVNEHIKQAVESGKVVFEDVIDKAHQDLKEIVEDITHGDIMQTYSDYGKVKQPSKDDYIKAKNQIKSQSFYKSATSDAEAGNPPYKRVTPSEETPEVRAARQEMEEAMKADNINWDSRPLEERRKSALDKVKQTLVNQIQDLTEAVDNNAKIERSRKTVELDEAAKELVQLRDQAKELYDQHFGEPADKKTKSDLRIARLKKSIEKLEDRIKNNDFGDKIKSVTDATPEETALAEKLAETRDKFKELRNIADPDYENRKRNEFLENYYNKRAEKRGEDINNQNFEPPQKPKGLANLLKGKTPEYGISDQTYQAWRKARKVNAEFKALQKGWQDNKQTRARKTLEAVLRWERSSVISRVGSIIKIAGMAVSETLLQPLDRLTARNVTNKLPGISSFAKENWKAYKGNISDDVRAIATAWDTAKSEAQSIWKSGKTTIDLTIGDKHIDVDDSLIGAFGKVHAMEKYFVKQSTFNRAREVKLQMMKDAGMDINSLTTQYAAEVFALKEANKSILLGDNIITSKLNDWKRLNKNASAGEVLLSGLVRFIMPVAKVPTNFVLNGVDRTYGAISAPIRYATEGFFNGFDKIEPEEKARIFEMVNKGLLGPALVAAGWFGYQNIGTFHVPGIKKDDDAPKEGSVFGIPSILLHNPRIAPILIGATARQIFEHESKDLDEVTKDVAGGFYMSTIALMAHNPLAQGTEKISRLAENKDWGGTMAQTFVSPLNPGIVQEAAEAFDNYRNGDGWFLSGNGTNRHPEGFMENIASGVPFWRESIDTKKDDHYQKIHEQRMGYNHKVKTSEQKQEAKRQAKEAEKGLHQYEKEHHLQVTRRKFYTHN